MIGWVIGSPIKYRVRRIVPLIAASHAALHETVAALVLGALIGVAGHIVRARWLVLVGIAIIGVAVLLFFASAASDSDSLPSPGPLPHLGSG